MKADLLDVLYEPSKTVEIQGKYEKTIRYQEQGYYIKEERNGYYVLVKPVKVWVTIGNDSEERTFNMKGDICEFYGRGRISIKLLERFQQDVANGRISFKLDSENNSYSIITA